MVGTSQPWEKLPVLAGSGSRVGEMVEAPGGVEPPHRSFADCSLNHLGTAPCVWIIEGKGQPDKEGNAVQGLRLKQRNLLLT